MLRMSRPALRDTSDKAGDATMSGKLHDSAIKVLCKGQYFIDQAPHMTYDESKTHPPVFCRFQDISKYADDANFG